MENFPPITTVGLNRYELIEKLKNAPIGLDDYTEYLEDTLDSIDDLDDLQAVFK